MTDTHPLRLHLRGLRLPPVPMRLHSGGAMADGSVSVPDAEWFTQRIPKAMPAIVGPSGEAVAVRRLFAMILPPGDTLLFAVTLSEDQRRKLGIGIEMER